MTDPIPNPRIINDLVPRAERWMKPKGWDTFPGWDNPAYDRMAEQVLKVMGAVGDANSVEGIAVLTKVLAMIYVKHIGETSNEEIAEAMQRWTSNLINEVVSFTDVVHKHKKRVGHMNA